MRHEAPLASRLAGSPIGRSSVFVAGHRGLAGSALVRALERHGCRAVITRSRSELDLADRGAVERFFSAHQVDHVLLAAAKVGGILANDQCPADFIRENLEIQTNVIHEAFSAGVKRLVFLGSSCIYPRECVEPIKEDSLLAGPLEPTNSAYAVAKIAGIEMCRAYNAQHGCRFVAVMPSNLYGPGDHYSLRNSHMLPALIRKMHEAKEAGDGAVEIWGTGRPRRELLHSDDLASAVMTLLGLDDAQFAQVVTAARHPLVNAGFGADFTVAEIARLVAEVVGFEGCLRYDHSKPDGTPSKLIDSSRMRSLGWQPRIGLRDGIAGTYETLMRQDMTFDS